MRHTYFALLFLLFCTATTHAQECTNISFPADLGQLYVDAETALDAENNPVKAIGLINQLKTADLDVCQRAAVDGLQQDIFETGQALDLDYFARPKEPVVALPPRSNRSPSSVSCDMVFDVSPKGSPENITADCSYLGYNSTARRSIARARYEPKIVDGNPVGRTGVHYNISYGIIRR